METMNIITQTLERVRRKLIDLSRRNNLINFRETKRTIKTIDEQPDAVFKLLVSGDNPLEFLPFEPEEEDQEEQTQIATQNSLPFVVQSGQKITTDNQESNKEVLKKTLIDTSISDKKTINDSPKAKNKKPPNSIQTPLLAQQLERRCKNLVRHSRTGIEESGINYLYLAMGFLEWRDSGNSDVRNEAPLILVPLIIERTRLNRQTKCYSYVIRYSGEDIETNLSLSEKLEHDFGLILPDIPEKPKPEEYIKMVGEVIKRKANWHVNGDMKVGFFSFAKLRLYKDLDDNVWPKGRRLTEHPIVKDILIGKESSEGSELRGYADDYEIDKYSFEEKTKLITDADSSQHSAIIDVLHYDKNIVIEGPPGTGKSQTITNLIGAALHQDKSVLFVSEKKAALEVVRNRLDKLGLGDFCLELHSYKTQKGLLHKDLEKRINCRYQDAMQLDNEIKDFKYERDRLQKYYDLLNQKPAKTGESIYEIFWAAERWKEQAGESYINMLISNPLNLGRIQSKKCIEAIEDFVSSLSELPQKVRQIWEGFDAKRLLPGDDTTLQEHFEAIAAKTTEFVDTLEKNKDACDSRFINNNLNRLRFLTNLNYDILNDPPRDFDRELARTFLEKEAKEVLVDLIEQIKLREGLIAQYEAITIADHSWSAKELKDIKARSQKTSSLKLTDRTFNELKELAPLTENIDQSFQQLRTEIENIKILYLDYPQKISECMRVVAIAKYLDSAISEIILHAHPNHALKICPDVYKKAYGVFKKLSEKIEEQSALFIIEKLPTGKEINDLAERFFQKKESLKRMFSSDYRSAKKKIHEFLKHKKNIKRKDLPEILSGIASIQTEIQEFNEDEDNKVILGSSYKGMSSEWERLVKMINWSQKLTKSIESEERTKEILSDFTGCRERAQSSGSKIKEILLSIANKLNQLNIKVSKDTKTKYFRNLIREINLEIKNLSQIIPEEAAINNLCFQEILKASAAGLSLAKLERDVANDQRYPRFFGNWYKGFDTEIEILESISKWISRLTDEGGFYKKILSWILTNEYVSKISLITLIGTNSKSYFAYFDSFLDMLSQNGRLDFDKWIGCSKEEANIKQIQDKITDCINNLTVLSFVRSCGYGQCIHRALSVL